MAIKKWQPYIDGKHAQVLTNHWPLTHLPTQPHLSPRQVHWMEFFASHKLTFEYQPGLKRLCLMILASSTLLFMKLSGWHVYPTNSMSIKTSPILLHMLAIMMITFVCMVRVITQPSTSCCMLKSCWYCLLCVVFAKLSFASCMTAPLVAIEVLREH